MIRMLVIAPGQEIWRRASTDRAVQRWKWSLSWDAHACRSKMC